MCCPLLGWESSGVESRPAVAGIAETRAAVDSGLGLQGRWGAVGAGRTCGRLAMRTHGGIVSAAHRQRVESAYARWRRDGSPLYWAALDPTYGARRGVRGALRGESPRTREGRNGPTVERQWPVVSGQELQGTGMAGSLKEVEGLVPQFWDAPRRKFRPPRESTRSSTICKGQK